ncbi:chromate transporter [Candidatus Hepatincola sp. Pdp]
MMTSTIKFIYANFLLGITSFGGGKAFIPMYQEVFLREFHITSQATLTQAITYATALPGPVATMITTYVGFLEYNMWAVVFGLLALCLPPLIIYLITFYILNKHMDNKVIKRISLYLSPAIIALLLYVVFDLFFHKSNSNFYYWYSGITLLVSTIILLKTKVHPIFIIIACGFIGYYVL